MTVDTARTSVVRDWLADRRPAQPAPAPGPEGAFSALIEENGQLKAALASNRRIGLAMGLIMGQLDVTEEQAFAVLRRISQNSNRRLHAVAEDVVHHRRL